MSELSGLPELARITDPVAQKFAAAGHRIYLVGGIVRDLFLAERPDTRSSDTGSSDTGSLDTRGLDTRSSDTAPAAKASDIDLTTDAHPAVIKSLVAPVADALWAQGERFGTIGATIEGRDFEVTTHRAETYDPDSRKPVVSFGNDLGEDLSRRDFTINAMAIELPSRELHDPYGGVADLEARLLRTPLSPEISFTDDPLRIMRAARFVARFDLTPAPELVEAATELSDRLSIVSVERVADELERLLAVAEPRAGLQFLADTGSLPFEADSGQLQLAITLASSNDELVVRRAGLLWPLDLDAQRLLKRLRYSRADTVRTGNLIGAAHAALTAESDFPAKTVRTIAASVGVDDLRLVTALVSNIVANDSRFDEGQGSVFAAAVNEVSESEDLSDLGSPLSGQAVIELLGVEPGPAVGQAQRFLSAKRLEQGPISESQASELLRAWWQEQ